MRADRASGLLCVLVLETEGCQALLAEWLPWGVPEEVKSRPFCQEDFETDSERDVDSIYSEVRKALSYLLSEDIAPELGGPLPLA